MPGFFVSQGGSVQFLSGRLFDKQGVAIGFAESIGLSAEIAMDGEIALFFQGFADFAFAQHYEHVADFFAVAAAMKDRVLRLECEQVVFPEKPMPQGFYAGIEHFIRFQG